jgi:hypothetical protein
VGDSQCNDSKVLQAVTDYLKECVGKLFELKSDEKLGFLFLIFPLVLSSRHCCMY